MKCMVRGSGTTRLTENETVARSSEKASGEVKKDLVEICVNLVAG